MCLFSLDTEIQGQSLEAIGSSGSLLCPGCVLFIVPLFPEIIGSLGLKWSPLPPCPELFMALLSKFLTWNVVFHNALKPAHTGS